MAIYSLNVATVGKSTHAPGTAGAHLRYIAREDAATHVEAEHMPSDAQEARTWMDTYEREARKNARLMNKVRIALPRELSHEQNTALARQFVAELTGGRIPSFMAIHDQGKDAANPHAHIVLIDRDMSTGKRVLRLSDSARDRKKAGLPENGVEWIRTVWEARANQALERAGHKGRIDRRTLEAQGLDREATIHIGPRAQHVDSQVKRPESKAVPAPTQRRPDRVIDYPMIDAGRTRRERNAEIIDLNLERAARSPHFETRVWAQFEREQRAKDRPLEARIVAASRRRTLEERRIRRAVAAQVQDVRARRDAESRLTRDWIKQRYLPESLTLRQRHAEERSDMTRQQRKLFGRFFAAVDFTGRTRAKREATRRALSSRHKAERLALAAQIRGQRTAQLEAVQARYRPELDALTETRKARLEALAERHGEEIRAEDALLQGRAIEREQDRRTVEQQITAWKRMSTDQESAQEAPARSKARTDWEDADGPQRDLTPEQRAEAARERMNKSKDSRKRDRNRRRRRSLD
jgi:hypothetical protein